jgi:magnesium chelatase family protein
MKAPVTYTRAQIGIAAPQVSVETHLTGGIPRFTIVGLPEVAVNESKERVRSALMNSQFEFPRNRITTNLAPADIPKSGGRYDLAIALGILAASRQIPQADLAEYEFAAELGLSGELRPVSGILSVAIAAAKRGRKLVVAPENAAEAMLLGDNEVYPCESLLAICEHLQGKVLLQQGVANEVRGQFPGAPATNGVAGSGELSSEGLAQKNSEVASGNPQAQICYQQAGETSSPSWAVQDLADVCGHAQAKRVLAIAAAGRHSLLMVGSPGTGKSLLSQCLPGIMPELTQAEALEVAAIHSLVKGSVDATRWRQAPFCAPHHTSSSVALVGGGKMPMPGLVSQAHCGVLFLDELAEFRRDVLEALREPLETGFITVARASGHITYPARFQLVAAMNPCPCGYLGDTQRDCYCSPQSVQRYQQKISGPILDRIDMHVQVLPIPIKTLAQSQREGFSSAEVREQVGLARRYQQLRQGCVNSAIPQSQLHHYCVLAPDAQELLEEAIDQLKLSPRSYHRLLRVARTIADLAAVDSIGQDQIAEAMSYRNVLGSLFPH